MTQRILRGNQLVTSPLIHIGRKSIVRSHLKNQFFAANVSHIKRRASAVFILYSAHYLKQEDAYINSCIPGINFDIKTIRKEEAFAKFGTNKYQRGSVT